MTGNLFVVSAPSGTGKTSIIQAIMADMDALVFSVSTTTRPCREGERDGKDYHFVDEDIFRRMIRRREFLEWAEVHGHYYGTSRTIVEREIGKGNDIILDVDVQGAKQVKKTYADSILVMIAPPSYRELKQRLTRRLLDSPEDIETRLRNAEGELKQADLFDYVIINRELSRAVEELKGVIYSFRLRRERMTARVREILHTFDT